ncbi:MAG: histidine phosphatase family protein [Leptolyngbya sp. RL_3_1]|nr:histidine phosphatase family protein [Leptolyngbya sp. RL_3_1]
MIAQLKSPLSIPGFPGYDLPPVPYQGTRVILLRHGRSTLNDAGCYQGSSDQSDLTSQGVLASRQVGQFLAHCPIDAIYVSPSPSSKYGGSPFASTSNPYSERVNPLIAAAGNSSARLGRPQLSRGQVPGNRCLSLLARDPGALADAGG